MEGTYHTTTSNNTTRDTIQSRWDKRRDGSLQKLDKDHQAEIPSIVCGKKGRKQRQRRRGYTRNRQPLYLVTSVVKQVTSGCLKQELTHAENEKQDTSLLFLVVLGDDEKGGLHVDHGQACSSVLDWMCMMSTMELTITQFSEKESREEKTFSVG